MGHGTLLDEDLHSRVAAVFPDTDSARAAAAELGQRFSLDLSRVSLLTPDQASLITQRNKLDHRVSGRILQRRQLKYTFISFSLMLVGMLVMHLLAENGVMTQDQVKAGLGVLITAAILLTVHGLLSWRHVRVLSGVDSGIETGVLLLVDLHDQSEQYAICQALDEMGVEVLTTAIAGHS